MDSSGRFPFSTDETMGATASVETGARVKGRDSLFLAAQLTIGDEAAVRDVRVRNLSAGGLMIESHRPIAEGTTVTLTLRGLGEVRGKVAWCAEGRVGVAFDEPIDPMLARKPVGKGPGTPLYAKPLLG